jgi:hypothetical protein
MTVEVVGEVLDACQNAGLRAVATVSDMGANSVKALKQLGATKRKPSFMFHNQEIATVYDPPRLLKCTQNLFLKYDVQLKSEVQGNQLPLFAKWDHILKLYELDKLSRFCLLYKLSHTHLSPVAQSAM